MNAAESLMIVGGSTRAAAFSALRAGLRPWCADLFADEDLRQRCPVMRVPTDRYPQGLAEVLDLAPPGPWMYTGALENRRGLIRQLAVRRPLWGVGALRLRQVRSPFTVWEALHARGLVAPLVYGTDAPLPLRRRWLRKPLDGAGGRGITIWAGDQPGPRHRPTWYVQEFIAGESYAAVFVGDGKRARLLGVTRQLVGETWLHAAPFQYCGSVGPLSLSAWARELFQRLGDVLVERFGLRGLFGVDAIWKDGEVWPVEINPRYTASVEVLEYATGLIALALHQQVFEPVAIPPPSGRAGGVSPPVTSSHRGAVAPRSPGCGGDVVGKAILYAPSTITFPNDGPWLDTLRQPQPVTELPAYADIPPPGQLIEKGWPVLTYFARAATEENCLQSLQQIAKALDRWLFRL